VHSLVLDSEEERRIYRFYLTEEDAVTAFQKGEVDQVSDLSRSYGLDDWEQVVVDESLRQDRYLAVFFDIRDPRFSKSVRQALNYALPKVNGEERAISPIDPRSWVYLEGGKEYSYDLQRALERILAELPGEPLNFTLTTTNTFRDDAAEIEQAWEAFGDQAYEACQNSEDVENKNLCENVRIDVAVRISNFPDTNDFDTLLIAQEIPPDPDQYYLWHSEQPTNFTGYKNTRIDSLLEQGRQVAEREERRAIYQEFQQFFLEDSPAVFLRHVWSYEIARE
jgi:peptide/nickel transport system substrate-binding protein